MLIRLISFSIPASIKYLAISDYLLSPNNQVLKIDPMVRYLPILLILLTSCFRYFKSWYFCCHKPKKKTFKFPIKELIHVTEKVSHEKEFMKLNLYN